MLKPQEATGRQMSPTADVTKPREMSISSEVSWPATRQFLDTVQSPKPIGANWADEMPADFSDICRRAKDELLIAQTKGEHISDDLWATIIDSSRAALVRNTVVLAEANWAAARTTPRLERARRPIGRKNKGRRHKK